MSYDRFIRELNKGIEGKITAYSQRDYQEGCLIYLQKLDQRIFVPASVIQYRCEDAIHALRTKINEGIGAETVLVLQRVGDELVFKAEIAALMRSCETAARQSRKTEQVFRSMNRLMALRKGDRAHPGGSRLVSYDRMG